MVAKARVNPGNHKPRTGKHACGWTNCPRLAVGGHDWACKDHMATLPLDLRMKVAKAFGPPKLVYLPSVEKECRDWIANQNPGNYARGLFFDKDGNPLR